MLWGETNEAVWRPRSDRMSVLRGTEGLASLEVARVEAALYTALECCDAGSGDAAYRGL